MSTMAALSWGLAAAAFGLCLVAAARGVEWLLVWRGAPRRHAWAVALLVAVLWPPLAYVVTSRAPVSVTEEPAAAPIAGTVVGNAAVLPSSNDSPTDPTPWLLGAWAMMSLLMIVHAWRAWRVLARERDASEPGLLLQTRVYRTAAVGPAVFGLRRPVLLMPSWVWELDPSLQQLVLRHEQEHCRAGDAWLVWLTVLSRVLMPWNPAVWWLGHRTRLALEMDCDARTLGVDAATRTHYARLLLLITQFRQRAHVSAAHFAPALLPLPSHLRRRITAMHVSPSSFRPWHRVAAFVLVGTAAFAACSRQIAGNLAGPANASAPVRAPDDERSLSAAASGDDSAARTTDRPYFDFQVESPATVMREGTTFPVYPPALRAANVTGTVLTQFVVGTDGVVEPGSVRILRSNHEAFSAAVREAVPSMRFRPATIEGRAVRQLVQQPFAFALDGTRTPTLDPTEATANRAGSTPPVPMTSSDTSARFDFQVDRPAVMAAGSTGPIYPPALRAGGVNGTVLAQFVVNADGRVDTTTVRVLKSDHDAFTQAVREALGRMRFEPATVQGRAVRQLLQQPFQFSTQR